MSIKSCYGLRNSDLITGGVLRAVHAGQRQQGQEVRDVLQVVLVGALTEEIVKIFYRTPKIFVSTW